MDKGRKKSRKAARCEGRSNNFVCWASTGLCKQKRYVSFNSSWRANFALCADLGLNLNRNGLYTIRLLVWKRQGNFWNIGNNAITSHLLTYSCDFLSRSIPAEYNTIPISMNMRLFLGLIYAGHIYITYWQSVQLFALILNSTAEIFWHCFNLPLDQVLIQKVNLMTAGSIVMHGGYSLLDGIYVGAQSHHRDEYNYMYRHLKQSVINLPRLAPIERVMNPCTLHAGHVFHATWRRTKHQHRRGTSVVCLSPCHMLFLPIVP